MADEIRCHWSLPAENVERIDSKLNIMGIFNAMTPDRVPFIMARAFCVISSWSGPRNTKTTYNLRITEPGGQLDPAWWWAEVPIEFTGSGRTYSVSPPIEHFEFPAYGDYRFDALFQGVVHVSTTLSILPKI